MHARIDAHVFAQALKSINIRTHMYPFVELQLHDGRFTLCTCTQRPSRWEQTTFPPIHARVSITRSLAIIEEGRYCASYEGLLNAVRLCDGLITLRQEEQAMLIEQVEGGQVKRQAVVEGIDDFPSVALPDAGETATSKQEGWETCPTCKKSHYVKHTNLYQVRAEMLQRTLIKQDRLASLCKQVAWATNDESQQSSRRGIWLELKHGVLSLQASDGRNSAQSRQSLADAKHWEQGILIPAKQLQRVLQLLPKKATLCLEAVFIQYQQIKKDEEEIHDAPLFYRARHLCLSTEDGQMAITLGLLNDTFSGDPDVFAQPQPSKTQIVCATAELRRACTAMGKIAQEHQMVLSLHITQAGVILELPQKDNPSGKPTVHQVSGSTMTGKDMKIALGWWCLREALAALTSPQVMLTLSTPEQLLVLCSTGAQEDVQGAFSAVEGYL